MRYKDDCDVNAQLNDVRRSLDIVGMQQGH